MSSGATRRRLLDAVLTVVAADGVRAVTHRRVADAAGVSLGTTTYHFGTREDMLVAAYELYLLDATAELERLFVRHAADVDGIVDALVELLRREFAEPGLVLVEYELYLAAARDPALATRLVAWETQVTAALVVTLERLGAARPVEAARTIVNLVRGLELERLTRPLTDDDIRPRLATVVAGLCERAGSTLDARPA